MTGIAGFKWKSEPLGLIAVASFIAIAVMVLFLIIQQQQAHTREQIRGQGISLVRLLANMPVSELTPAPGRQGILSVIRQSLISNHFAYVALVSPEGQPLTTETATGIIVPGLPLSPEPSNWVGQRQLALPGDTRQVTEFYAPLLQQTELKAFVRLAFFEPNLAQLYPLLPFYGSLTLLIFLPVCGLYLLTRRELRPLSTLNSQISTLINDQQQIRPVKIEASGALLDFSHNFNRLMSQMQQRLAEQEQLHRKAQLSGKIDAFQLSRAQSMLQSIPEAIFVLDDMNRLSYANNQLASYLELDGPLPEDAQPEDWCPYPEICSFLTRKGSAGNTTGKTSHLLFSISDAHSRTLEFSCYPLFSPKNQSCRFGTLVVGRDVTETRRAIQNRGEFIAQVAHELKSPLNVLSLYSEALMGEDGKDNSFRIDACNIIKSEVDRASQLISNLLNLNKLEEGCLKIQRQRVRLQDLLKEAFDSHRSSAPDKALQFELKVPDEISPLNVDKELIRIAVTNLLTNAIKYSNPNGKVTLCAKESESSIIIQVNDEGIGISEADSRRIFDKFFRSDDDNVRERAGHGLGLSLAKEIVELHHGHLELDSTPGQGSRFSIHFRKTTGLLQQVII
ncbi:MAG: ATP-binding protein [Pontibacterium sp.]